MILALLAAPLKVTAAEQNGESSDKQQNETTEQKTEETEETAPEMTTDLGLASPSVLLMEAQTGTVLYEKNASEQRSPASITKIMTLLLIFEELEKGTLQLTDEVTTSAHARSMGGSQVFLEEGEKQTVETMIKCIVVASGNDASVAMAEHIAGTESEFVSRMNQKAKELGMNDTKFEDCCGLTDSDGHYTTAADVAKMSRELIERFPQILNYSSIWMEEITHVTQKGSKPFTLTNTNKLIRGYEGCVGLKTGSTSKAKYCVSAVAKKNDAGSRDGSTGLQGAVCRCSVTVPVWVFVLQHLHRPGTRSPAGTFGCLRKAGYGRTGICGRIPLSYDGRDGDW